MLMIPEVVFVTGNENKWKEVQAILGDGSKVMRANLDLPELQGSIEEIARLKSREAASQIGGPVIIEDSALAFDALGGLPGPYIKWFMDAVGLEGLNDMLVGFPGKNGGKAICTFAYCAGPGAEPIIFQGVTTGEIVRPRGPLNFGWEPIFQPDHESGMTYAEMDPTLKNSLSHRYKALAGMSEYFARTAHLEAGGKSE